MLDMDIIILTGSPLDLYDIRHFTVQREMPCSYIILSLMICE